MAKKTRKKTVTKVTKKIAKKTQPKKVTSKPVRRTPEQVLAAFKKTGARIETRARVQMNTKEDFALYYTPGVGTASTHLAAHPEDARTMSVKRNSVAVISDGTAVLGLGNIGPYGALPVMEGKALIFKEKANIDAWPIVLDVTAQDPEARITEIVNTIISIAPAWGGINLEDFSAPNCFEIERRVIEALDIPVMHDDQHGTAIVALAGLINAAKVVKKDIQNVKIVISGAGAAGVAITKLLLAAKIEDIIVTDRVGIIEPSRTDLNKVKQELAEITNPRMVSGDLMSALVYADVFIGVSSAGLLTPDHIKVMAEKPIIFALANPVPEIMPDEARAAGAAVVATGRSDFPNQINNALVFPGIFRGALDQGLRRITTDIKLRAAQALANLIKSPTAEKIIPDILDPRVVKAIAKSVH